MLEEEERQKRMDARIEPGLSLSGSCFYKTFLKFRINSGPQAPRHLPMFFLRVLHEQGYLKAFVKVPELSLNKTC